METNTLRVRRAERRWSQADAAEAAGLPFWTYRNIEIGATEPRLGQIVALQRAFQSDVAVLFPALDAPIGSPSSPAPAD